MPRSLLFLVPTALTLAWALIATQRYGVVRHRSGRAISAKRARDTAWLYFAMSLIVPVVYVVTSRM